MKNKLFNKIDSKKNLILLLISQAIFVSATIISFTFAGLVGSKLSVNPTLATLPIAFTSIGTLVAIFPASFLMKKFGRKFGFLLGSISGIVCGIFAFLSIQMISFSLFCGSCCFMGIYQAFFQYLRFAAVEVVHRDYASQAISIVLLGGVIGAIVGPELGTLSERILPLINYGQAYLLVTFISLFSCFVTLFLKLPKQEIQHDLKADLKKSILKLAFERNFVVTIINISIGYFLMIFLMTATPLAMRNYNFDIAEINQIIRWHLLGMYLPSFFTGHLIFKFGISTIFYIGITLLALSCAAVYLGSSYEAFIIALIAIGVGWNFMYIGGSTLLLTVGSMNEKAIVQALNEIVIFSICALASCLAGLFVHVVGWHNLSIFCVPFLVVAVLTTGYLQTSKNDMHPSLREEM
jgi:predicted MFS family arabinose efflux permease